MSSFLIKKNLKTLYLELSWDYMTHVPPTLVHSASRLGCTYRKETEAESSELHVKDMELKAQGDQGM